MSINSALLQEARQNLAGANNIIAAVRASGGYKYATEVKVRTGLEGKELDKYIHDAAAIFRRVVIENSIAHYIMAHQIELSWPSTWWQSFKERWFPQWAKKLWPVVRTTRGGLVDCTREQFLLTIQEVVAEITGQMKAGAAPDVAKKAG